MENTRLNDLKEVLRLGMIENFKQCGYLAPIFFFYENGEPVITMIPNELLENSGGKQILAALIRKICKKPTVLAAGIIIEANAAKLDNDDSELTKKVMNGELKVSELEQSQDIILMIFSTPSKEEMISYVVDCEAKTVGESLSEGELDGIGGTFSHFFNWNIN